MVNKLNMSAEELRDLIVEFNNLTEISQSKRTEKQQERIFEIQAFLSDWSVDIMEVVCAEELRQMRDDEADEFHVWSGRGNKPSYFALLDDVLYKTFPPKLQNVTVADLHSAVTECYSALVTISGKLELLEPMLERWSRYERRINDIIKGLCAFEKEWKTTSVSAAVFPADVAQKIARLHEYVRRFRIRQEMLSTSYSIMSRLITLHIDTPAGELSRYGSDKLLDEANDLRNRTKGGLVSSAGKVKESKFWGNKKS